MNVERLNHLVRTSGKTKRQISDECGISRVTLDGILAGCDVKVSTLEALADSLGVWVGIFFDDPAGLICQTGGQNTVIGDNVWSENQIPAGFISMMEAKDRQVERLINILEKSAVAAPQPLGKSSAREYDGGATACQPDLNGGR